MVSARFGHFAAGGGPDPVPLATRHHSPTLSYTASSRPQMREIGQSMIQVTVGLARLALMMGRLGLKILLLVVEEVEVRAHIRSVVLFRASLLTRSDKNQRLHR